MEITDFSQVRGFNYQPGYGSTSYENWRFFDAAQITAELSRGKVLFPGMNTVRLWLSFGAWRREKEEFAEHFETLIAICASLGLRAVPCLFNRWHNAFCDNDGLYLDAFAGETDRVYIDFVEGMLRAHKNDRRVLLWDLCNEPFAYHAALRQMKRLAEAEKQFLASITRAARNCGVVQPIGISLSGNDIETTLPLTAELCDVLLIHPYWMHEADENHRQRQEHRFLESLDWQVAFARQAGKPLLVTETCWGSVDDDWRCENMRVTLDALTAHGLGFLAHGLCHSLVADLHAPADGPILDDLGQFNFIEKDGALRPGHALFNTYCAEAEGDGD